MARPAWSIVTPAVALVGSTAKTCLLIEANATDPVELVGFEVSVDAQVQVLVEIFESNLATTGTRTTPTAGQAGFPKQLRGFMAADSTAPGMTARHSYTVEPTTLEVLKSYRFLGPGPLLYQFPLARELQTLLSASTRYKAIGFRLTAASACNVIIGAEVEE